MNLGPDVIFVLWCLSWAVSAIVLLVYAIRNFNSPPTQRSGTTGRLFVLGCGMYVLALSAVWLSVVSLIMVGGTVGGLLLSAEMPEWLRPSVPLVAVFVTVMPIEERYRKIDERVRRRISELVSIGTAVDRLMLAMQISPFAITDEGHRQRVAAEASSHGLDPDALPWSSNDDSVGSKIVQVIALKEIMAPRPANGDWPPLSEATRRFKESSPHFAAKHSRLVDDAERRYREKAPFMRDAVSGAMSPDEYDAFNNEMAALLTDLRRLAVRSALARSRDFAAAEHVLSEFFYTTKLKDRNIIGFAKSVELCLWATLVGLLAFTAFFTAVRGIVLPELFDVLLRVALIVVQFVIAALCGYFFAKVAASQRVLLLSLLGAGLAAAFLGAAFRAAPALIGGEDWMSALFSPWAAVTFMTAAGTCTALYLVRRAAQGRDQLFAEGMQAAEWRQALQCWLIVTTFALVGYGAAFALFAATGTEPPPGLNVLTALLAAMIAAGVSVGLGFSLLFAAHAPPQSTPVPEGVGQS